jgi:hypothetical protein
MSEEGDKSPSGSDGRDSEEEDIVADLREENEQLKRLTEKLKAENNALRNHLGIYESNMTRLTERCSCGIGRYKVYEVTPKSEQEIKQCIGVLYIYLVGTVWTRQKFLPLGWEEWNVKNKTLTCAKVCKRMKKNLPKGWLLQSFWPCVLVPSIRNKFTDMRSQSTSKLKAIYKCASFGNIDIYC